MVNGNLHRVSNTMSRCYHPRAADQSTTTTVAAIDLQRPLPGIGGGAPDIFSSDDVREVSTESRRHEGQSQENQCSRHLSTVLERSVLRSKKLPSFIQLLGTPSLGKQPCDKQKHLTNLSDIFTGVPVANCQIIQDRGK